MKQSAVSHCPLTVSHWFRLLKRTYLSRVDPISFGCKIIDLSRLHRPDITTDTMCGFRKVDSGGL